MLRDETPCQMMIGKSEVTSRPQIQRAASQPPLDSIISVRKWLDSLHVLGLPALGAFDHIELNC